MSGDGSQPTSQTVTQTTIPEYLRPQVESMVGQAAGLMQGELERGYQPFQGQRVAGFSPMQAQAFQNVAGQQVAPQLTDASNMALGAGQAAMGYGAQASGIGQQAYATAEQQAGMDRARATQFGQMGANLGLTGMGNAATAQQMAEQQADIYGQQGLAAGLRGESIGARGVSAAEQGFGAGAQYAQQATSPQAMQSYMSPYMQNVVDVQQQEAMREADILRQSNQARAVQSGAYGGSRQGVVEAELQRNLATQLGRIQAEGSQRAFEQAQQAQQFGAGLGIQGLQAGLQGLQSGMQGTGQAITGAGLGLQGTGQRLAAGQLGLQGVQTGLEGQRVGLAGTQAATQAGQFGLAGAQTGISGQQAGIAGSQAGIGAAGQLGQLGGQQFEQQMGITDAMQKYGALQQAQRQQELDYGPEGYQNYLAAQNFPYQQIGFFSDIIRGLPMSQSSQTMYGGQPSVESQIPGILMAGAGYMGGRKEGGQIKKYAEGGAVSAEGISIEDAMGLRSKLRRLSDSQLSAYARVAKDAITLSALQSEVDRRSKMRQPYAQAPEATTANAIAKRAEAAAVSKPRVGMAGGGIVALAPGGEVGGPFSGMEGYGFDPYAQPSEPPTGPSLREMLTPESMKQSSYYRSGTAMGVDTPAVTLPEVQASTPSVTDLAYADDSRRRDVMPEAPPAPSAPPGIAGALQARQEAQPTAGTGMGVTFDQFRQMASQVEPNPEDQAVLADMQKRVQDRLGRAEGREDKSIYDAMMMAGLAMMGGNSLADGLAKAAQVGGATYFASRKETEKAIADAENAELAFNKYKMELRRGDEEAAAKMFNNYQKYVIDLKQLDAEYARTAAIGSASQSSKLDSAYRTLQGQIDRTTSSIARKPIYAGPISMYEKKAEQNIATPADLAAYNQAIADMNAEIAGATKGMNTRLLSLENQLIGSGFSVQKVQ